MQGRSAKTSSGKRVFNTLAQTATQNKAIKAPFLVVYGKGRDLSQKDVLCNLAKKKAMTQRLIRALIEVAEEKGETKWLKSYWNTWHCQNRVQSANGKLFGKLCKNRICTVCCGIRKAEIINKYYDTVSHWEAPHLVTITIQAVSAGLLNSRMKGMLKAFQKIVRKYTKWHSRGKSIKLIGIKSLECNFNPLTKEYNPHFHIIVPTEAIGKIIIQEWKKYWGYPLVGRKGQDIKKINNVEGALREVIKYSSKIITKPKMKEVGKQKIPPTIYASALHNILASMKGIRIFDRFGFDLPEGATKKTPIANIVFEFQDWEFDHIKMDWISNNAQPLTGFTMKEELNQILCQNINQVLE